MIHYKLCLDTSKIKSSHAEESFNDMADGLRIKMEVRDSGIIVYEFPEIVKRIES